MQSRVREKEVEGRLESHCSCTFWRCFIIKIGGDAPCAPIYSVKISGLGGRWTNVRARRWRRWYDQVIPLSELSAARGYLQSVPFFFVPSSRRPYLASRHHALEILPKWAYERKLSHLWPACMTRIKKDFSFLTQHTQRQSLDTFRTRFSMCRVKIHYRNFSVVYLFSL